MQVLSPHFCVTETYGPTVPHLPCQGKWPVWCFPAQKNTKRCAFCVCPLLAVWYRTGDMLGETPNWPPSLAGEVRNGRPIGLVYPEMRDTDLH